MASERTGRLVFLSGPETIEIREYEVPPPEPGGLLAEVVRANVCGSELHIYGGGHPHVREGVLGHEGLCRIVELGAGVRTDYAGQPVAEGDLVAPAYFITCGHCAACGRGERRLCANAYRYWSRSPDEHPHFHGTFATHYHIHPEQAFFRVPSSLDPAAAAGANCALSQVIYGLDQVGVGLGESVVVQGAGGLGLNAVAVANERGAETIVIEGVDRRLERAEAFGADHLVDMREFETPTSRAERVRELTDGEGADLAVEVAGVPPAFAEGLQLVRDGGRYLEMGNIIPGRSVDVDPGRITRSSIEIRGIVRYDPWYLRRALDFLEAHRDTYPHADLLDAEFELEDVEEAISRSERREVTRATLRPNG